MICNRMLLRSAFVSLCMAAAPYLHVTAQGPATTSSAPVSNDDTSPPLRWWKGNTHTHSLWSDGDEFPEMIAAWYVEHDYNFLALSDHNTFSSGIRWMPLKTIESRAGADALANYQRRFGSAWVEMRTGKDGEAQEVRLKPLNEFRSLVEQSGRFLMIQAEEITDKADTKPVHMNGINLETMIKPLGGATVREVMSNNLRQVLEQEKALGREILPHLNHPNFGYGITTEELASILEEKFFEVHNGHPGVNQLGDKDHPGIDAMWDMANAIRMLHLDAEPLYGIATDDSHNYHGKANGARTGRGWVQVRSRYLTPDHLIRAMKEGDFYASSGVTLQDVKFDEQRRELVVEVSAEQGETYTIEFIASLKSAVPASDTKKAPGELLTIDPAAVGVTVAEIKGSNGTYVLTGKELYVRARITSSAEAADPSWKGQRKQAWTQPVGWKKAGK
ncbi:MAG: hypothetical protein U0892_06180 [Pirellulales bacterium]